jgi:ubiquinone/menaquinone biosynthesis C-methylase UbiE
MDTKPIASHAGYVDNQRSVNSRHTDGREQSSDEEAIRDAIKLCKFIKHIKAPQESFLDAGCRIGYAMEAFTSEFPSARVTGVDIVPEFVGKADRYGEAVVADLCSLPFAEREFDWVFCDSSIEHTADVAKAAHELQRVAAVGCYIITDLESKERFDANPSHYTRCDDPMTWVRIFDSAEWVPVSISCPTPVRIEMLWMRTEQFKLWRERTAL